MEKDILFVSGMFRSGTTLLSRMLNNHPGICVASDPIRPLINSFRYDCQRSEKSSEDDRFLPLQDYFLDYENFKKVVDAELDSGITAAPSELWTVIKNSALPYSRRWAEELDISANAQSYGDALDYALQLIEKTYSTNGNECYVGFKEVWATEFCPALLKSRHNSKCIIIIRDPRAVVASKNSTDEPYPIFFLARQWRKIAFIATWLQAQYPERVLLLQYENLISSPEHESNRICNFLGIENHKDFLDIENYSDGEGKPWSQNSSYSFSNSQTFQEKSIDKWKTKLDQSDIALIELICHDWMKAFNYQSNCSISNLLSMPATAFKRLATQQLASWIKPFTFDDNSAEFNKQVIIEKLRLSSVQNNDLSSDDDLNNLQISRQTSHVKLS